MNRKISKRLFSFVLVLVLSMSISSLFSCKNNTKYNESDITYFAFGCSHMNYYECYNFSLDLKTKELFVNCRAQNENGEVQDIDFSRKKISQSDIDSFLSLMTKYDVVEEIRHYKEPFRPFQIMDETTYSSSVSLNNKESFTGGELSSKEKLREFFTGLALKYK